jgi:hypothetical protein
VRKKDLQLATMSRPIGHTLRVFAKRAAERKERTMEQKRAITKG